MKRLLFAILQFVLFFAVYAAGSFAAPFHLQRVLSVSAEGAHVFVYDGVLLMSLLLLLILGFEAARKRLAAAAPWTLTAFVLAFAAGFALRLGFLTM
jgi:hypothetical protein